MGNHDAAEPLRSVFPDVPLDPSGHVQSVMDVDAGRLIFMDTTKPGTHSGWYDAERLDWLEEQLRQSAGRPMFLFMHHPPFLVGIPAMDRIALTQIGEFNARMTPYLGHIRHLFFGHVHRPICGSWHGVAFSTLRGTNHQVWLDFAEPQNVPGSHEPPTGAIVLIDDANVVVYFHDFMDTSRKFSLADVGYSFWEEQDRRHSA